MPYSRLPLLLTLLTLPFTVGAHQLDEYLQATLVAVDAAEIRLDILMTPGTAVAEQVLALVDRDGDGAISAAESADYGELLKRDLSVQLDARYLELKLTNSDIPEPAELRTGTGFMQLEFSAPSGSLASGTHMLTLQNRHFPNVSVYQVNASLPKPGAIQIIRQSRNDKQSSGAIEFTFQPLADPSRAAGIIVVLAGLLVAVLVGGWMMLRQKSQYT